MKFAGGYLLADHPIVEEYEELQFCCNILVKLTKGSVMLYGQNEGIRKI